jgi:hypothetical protein
MNMSRIFLAVVAAAVFTPLAVTQAASLTGAIATPAAPAEEFVLKAQYGRCPEGTRAVTTENGRFLRCEQSYRGRREQEYGRAGPRRSADYQYTPYCRNIYGRCAAAHGQGSYQYQYCANSQGC